MSVAIGATVTWLGVPAKGKKGDAACHPNPEQAKIALKKASGERCRKGEEQQ